MIGVFEYADDPLAHRIFDFNRIVIGNTRKSRLKRLYQHIFGNKNAVPFFVQECYPLRTGINDALAQYSEHDVCFRVQTRFMFFAKLNVEGVKSDPGAEHDDDEKEGDPEKKYSVPRFNPKNGIRFRVPSGYAAAS